MPEKQKADFRSKTQKVYPAICILPKPLEKAKTETEILSHIHSIFVKMFSISRKEILSDFLREKRPFKL